MRGGVRDDLKVFWPETPKVWSWPLLKWELLGEDLNCWFMLVMFELPIRCPQEDA